MNLMKYVGEVPNFFGGLIVGSLVTFGIVMIIATSLVVYIYPALAWQTIAKKEKYKKDWIAWIPIANYFLFPILAREDKNWRYGFLFFVPVVNVVMLIIWLWKIFEKRKYPGWFSLAPVIPEIGFILYLVAIGFVAWSDKKTSQTSKKKKK